MGLQGWLAIGLVVALPFLTLGVGRIDPAARGAWTFRLLALPGCVVLWPVVLRNWIRGRQPNA